MFYFRIVPLYLLVVNVLGYTVTYYDLEKADQLFADFIRKYERKYESAEEYSKRFEIFKADLKRINELNYNNKDHRGGYEVSQFSDQDSYRACIDISKRLNITKVEVKREFIINAPAEIDYRYQNLITNVKDQNPCGACYAFAAIGNIEGMYAKATGHLISLSAQQGLDCDNVDRGCDGGEEIHVMNALASQGGSMAEADYPYFAAKGICHTDFSKIKVKVLGGTIMNTPNVETLKGALYQNGAPLATHLFASYEIQRSVGKIILNPSDCNYNQANHAVLLVGYKTDFATGKPYWIIKNSWGTARGYSIYVFHPLKDFATGKPYWIIKNSWGTARGDYGYFYLDMESKCSIAQFGATTAHVG